MYIREKSSHAKSGARLNWTQLVDETSDRVASEPLSTRVSMVSTAPRQRSLVSAVQPLSPSSRHVRPPSAREKRWRAPPESQLRHRPPTFSGAHRRKTLPGHCSTVTSTCVVGAVRPGAPPGGETAGMNSSSWSSFSVSSDMACSQGHGTKGGGGRTVRSVTTSTTAGLPQASAASSAGRICPGSSTRAPKQPRSSASRAKSMSLNVISS